MEQIVKYEPVNQMEQIKAPLDNFLKRVSTKPKNTAVKKNQFANNAEYLEIGYIQAELDRVYHGLWSWQISQVQSIINGIMVAGTLKVFHPVTQMWIERSGVAFKQYQLKKDVTEPVPANLSAKALERDIPIANAEAFKNACKSLGNAFGRNLNRNFDFEHIPDEKILENLIPLKDERP